MMEGGSENELAWLMEDGIQRMCLANLRTAAGCQKWRMSSCLAVEALSVLSANLRATQN